MNTEQKKQQLSRPTFDGWVKTEFGRIPQFTTGLPTSTELPDNITLESSI